MSEQPSMLDVNPAVRRDLDFYPTPSWMTQALLSRVLVGGRIFEPCAGDGAIVRPLSRHGEVWSNDLAVRYPLMPHWTLDATKPESWREFGRPFDWIVTNPPFNLAFPIVTNALSHCLSGMAFLLRLSWLEPTEERGEWLRAHPPTRLIVMPRHDFRGDGKTDSVTSAWMIWDRSGLVNPGVDVVTKRERDMFPKDAA